ncbi:MAG: FtsQ-type POTRA domain-containing protein [Acidimicrobiia bacterium]|nr:FtsQ-type POTRA domain-containing protein [Acidimicrobiia bacterium]MDH3396409.1 FtsQ-type POTRA domain-containing protein [Acidimicrobiia bacterium]
MTTRVDPRLAERRRTVAEGNARKRLRRILWALLVVSLVAAVGWVAQSPWFSIAHVAVSGVGGSDAHRILETNGIVEGTPLISVAPRRVEALLQEDPWIADATVRRVIPDAIEVVVKERIPFAWVQMGKGWAVIAEDLTVLRNDGQPTGPSLVIEVSAHGRGDRVKDPRVIGGVTFLAGLPIDTRNQVSLAEQDGELWADVGGLAVRLGLPTEMKEKAAALLAILGEGIPSGSVVNLVAPTRPAVVEPSP